MKKQAAYYGCEIKYSGNQRKMYIIGEESNAAVIAIKALNLPFELIAQ